MNAGANLPVRISRAQSGARPRRQHENNGGDALSKKEGRIQFKAR